MADLTAELHHSLQASRAGLLSRLEGLGEYDLRRPRPAHPWQVAHWPADRRDTTLDRR